MNNAAILTREDISFELDVGKTTFVFRTEIADEDVLKEALEEAFERFETTTDSYKIRVFKTSEFITRKGKKVDASFLAIKIEGVNFRSVALRMSKVFNYLTLLDFGIRSNERFEIDADSKSIRLLKSGKTVSAKGIFRKAVS